MIEDFYEPIPVVDEEDLFLEWEDFKKKHPDIAQEEFELKQKEFQEM